MFYDISLKGLCAFVLAESSAAGLVWVSVSAYTSHTRDSVSAYASCTHVSVSAYTSCTCVSVSAYVCFSVGIRVFQCRHTCVSVPVDSSFTCVAVSAYLCFCVGIHLVHTCFCVDNTPRALGSLRFGSGLQPSKSHSALLCQPSQPGQPSQPVQPSQPGQGGRVSLGDCPRRIAHTSFQVTVHGESPARHSR